MIFYYIAQHSRHITWSRVCQNYHWILLARSGPLTSIWALSTELPLYPYLCVCQMGHKTLQINLHTSFRLHGGRSLLCSWLWSLSCLTLVLFSVHYGAFIYAWSLLAVLPRGIMERYLPRNLLAMVISCHKVQPLWEITWCAAAGGWWLTWEDTETQSLCLTLCTAVCVCVE